MYRFNVVTVFHSDYGVCGLPQPVYTESETEMPYIDDERYANYPFIVAKYLDRDGQTLLRVFINSKPLLQILVNALNLGCDPNTLQNLNGLDFLPFRDDLYIYLEEKKSQICSEVDMVSSRNLDIASESSFPGILLEDGIAELELLVHGFLKNHVIFPGQGLHSPYDDGFPTPENTVAINDLCQRLNNIERIFYRPKNLPQDQYFQDLGFNSMEQSDVMPVTTW